MKSLTLITLLGVSTALDCSFSEADNSRGSNQCWYDSECSGDRYCQSSGWCTGTSNCPTIDCSFSECNNDSECSGSRYCYSSETGALCSGESNCPSEECAFSEADNARGSNQCYNDSECSGDRYCSSGGWCSGDSNCPRAECAFIECYDDSECSGNRYCASTGRCYGVSDCVVEEPEEPEPEKIYTQIGGQCDSSYDCVSGACCSVKASVPAVSLDDYCTTTYPCDIGYGDCAGDNTCKPGLKCGERDNFYPTLPGIYGLDKRDDFTPANDPDGNDSYCYDPSADTGTCQYPADMVDMWCIEGSSALAASAIALLTVASMMN